MNIKALEVLDKANTDAYGHPVATKVRVTPVAGQAILIRPRPERSGGAPGVDPGKGVNVYTHGEILSAHGYPGLKKYPHLGGNYGGAWQDQRHEFVAFPGAIRRFFLIGGCDGSGPGRNYYTELARAVPDDCVILTLACGKYRFNKLDFGTSADSPGSSTSGITTTPIPPPASPRPWPGSSGRISTACP